MSIRRAFVSRPRDDGGGIQAFLVRDIVDRQSVFVVTVADVTAVVLCIGTAVLDALCIVNIAVLASAAWAVRVRNVVEVDVDQSGSAGGVARCRANSNGIAEFLVLLPSLVSATSRFNGSVPQHVTYHYNIVRATDWQIVEPARKVSRGAEILRGTRVEIKELLHVEELNAVVDRLRSDHHVITVSFHFAPSRIIVQFCLLREASDVRDLALFGDLSESSAISLVMVSKSSIVIFS